MESDDDEETIAPVDAEAVDAYEHVLIRTHFRDAHNIDYLGSCFWDISENISVLQPVMYLNERGDKGVFFGQGLLSQAKAIFYKLWAF